MSGSVSFGGNSPISLGNFVFQGFEVPQAVKWGGLQMLKVHKLVGGQRVVDAMGPDDADVTWSGVLLSSDASSRADQLNQMRSQGQQQALVFLSRYYLVVIKAFEADQRRTNYVPYKLTCTVLQDQSSSQPAPDPTALEAVSGDVDTAAAIPPPPELVQVPVLLVPAQTSLANLAELDAGTAATASIIASVAATQAAIAAAADSAQLMMTELAEAATASSVLGTVGSAEATEDAMTQAADAALASAIAAQMGFYLGRAQNNLGNL